MSRIEDAPPKVAALILAAGLSRRMGARNKLLEEVDGKAMIVSVVDALLASRARPVIVVLGHEAGRVRTALEDHPVAFVDNPDFARGLSTSLRSGIEALPVDADAVVVCLGDMPRISPAHIDSLIDAFAPADGRAICVPTVAGKRGNPVLWGRRFFDEMRTVEGDIGAREIIRRHADVVHAVAVDDEAILIDIDNPEDLAAARKR